MRIEAELEDPTHLLLQRPLDMPVGSKVVLELLTPAAAAERDQFLAASAALLERAYGDGEPDYSESGEPLTSPQQTNGLRGRDCCGSAPSS